jgi:hypothetical protein
MLSFMICVGTFGNVQPRNTVIWTKYGHNGQVRYFTFMFCNLFVKENFLKYKSISEIIALYSFGDCLT